MEKIFVLAFCIVGSTLDLMKLFILKSKLTNFSRKHVKLGQLINFGIFLFTLAQRFTIFVKGFQIRYKSRIEFILSYVSVNTSFSLFFFLLYFSNWFSRLSRFRLL
jgi:hypothetical protein